MALRKVKEMVNVEKQTSEGVDGVVTETRVRLKDTVLMGGSISVEEANKRIMETDVNRSKQKMSLLEKCEEIMPVKNVSTKGAALSIVNNKNGKRVKIATPILVELNSPNAVRFLVNQVEREVYIVAAQAEEVAHNLAGKSTKNMVYSAGLVERLTSLFELDYSSRTSHSIGTWTVTEEEGTKMICVRVAEEVPEEQPEELEDEHAVSTQVTEPVSDLVSESSVS
ncbi:Uncharacterised protein [Lysinibacillus sphaericus]|nr:Uncharacterised protein [Lysinibacillus sphaericus]